MTLPEFNYLAPRNISEACTMLKEHRGEAKVLAGGTDLLVSMKNRVKSPSYLIDLKRIPDLSYIKQNGKEVRVGILTLISELERSNMVKKHFTVLAEAAQRLASPNIRNLGTIGGNICLDTRCTYYNKPEIFRKSLGACLKFGGTICHVVKTGKKCLAVSQTDLAPALIALKARVRIQGNEDEKVVPIEDLYRDDGKDYLQLKAEELVTEVLIPYPEPGTTGTYQKLSLRKSIDFARMAVAVNLTVKKGLCENIRIVLGSIGSRPIRVTKAEDLFKGKKINEKLIEEAADFAYRVAKPVANMVNVLPPYRKEMARIMTSQAIQKVRLGIG